MGRSKTISISGACQDIQVDDPHEVYVTVSLGELNQKIFEKFMALYNLRQEHITDFLKAARGF
jgi:hypothetical protein